ncbi:MAG: hypothetical protein AAF447_02810 [Myxococcota bacterium]
MPITLRRGRLYRGPQGRRPLRLAGVNAFALPWLGAFDRPRLDRELDRLAALGLNAVRFVATSHGPDDAPHRVHPSLQPAPGAFRGPLIEGLGRCLEGLKARGLVSIVAYGNFWHWTGGFAQLRAWAGAGPLPYPVESPEGAAPDWDRYTRYAAGLYADPGARALYAAGLTRLVPVVAASGADVLHELANEPRGLGARPAFVRWLDEQLATLRRLAPGALVLPGTEGSTRDPESAGLDFERDHERADLASLHLWPENWGVHRPGDDERAFAETLAWARGHLREHAFRAAAMHRPLLLEETGLARDAGAYGPATPTTRRARFVRALLAEAEALASEGAPLAGLLLWAWAGEGVPRAPGGAWAYGDALGGDPPHEPQGWYGIYAGDDLAPLRELGEWGRA